MDMEAGSSFEFTAVPMFVLTTRLNALGIRKLRRGRNIAEINMSGVRKRGRRPALTDDDTEVILELRRNYAEKAQAKVC